MLNLFLMSHEMKNFKIGYLTLLNHNTSGSFIGASLILDINGIPLEFKCTQSLKPTMLQKALYGDRLVPYIGAEVFGRSILASLSNLPNLVIVDREYLLELQPHTGFLIVFVSKDNDLSDFPNAENITQLRFSSGYMCKFLSPERLNLTTDQVLEMLELISSKMDILEPFKRIAASVEVIGQSESQFA
jgi:hypothetical protein